MAFYKEISRFISIVITVALVILLFYFSYSYMMGVAYPFKYKKLVKKAALRHNTDKYLLLAIIREESRFKESSISKKGAIGLMQLMPKTAKWISLKRGLAIDKQSLFKPAINIDQGSWYYSYLKQRYKRQDLALAAYNSGTSVLDRWLKENPQGKIEQFIYPETADFVQRVNKTQEIYEKLYPEDVF